MTMKDSTTGITAIVHMKDWNLPKFSTNSFMQIVQCLQGHTFSVKVDQFLVAYPPAAFGKIWNIVKPMLFKSFKAMKGAYAHERQDELMFYWTMVALNKLDVANE
jgi:hypothetical protein